MARTGIMLAVPFEEKRLFKWPKPWFIQPKLDGNRCRAFISKDGGVVLLSSEGNIIESVPHIVQALERSHLRDIELDGELYIHGKPHQYIHSIVGRTVNIHPEHEEVELHIFDLIDPKIPWEIQVDRAAKLLKIEDHLQHPLVLVDTYLTNDLEDIMRRLETFQKDGYEGFILRHHTGLYYRKRSTSMMKFKPRKSDFYLIVGFKEEMSKDGVLKGTLGALKCVSQTGEEWFYVGTGFTADQRRELWESRELLIGNHVRIKYQHTTPRGVPRFPVFTNIAIGGER